MSLLKDILYGVALKQVVGSTHLEVYAMHLNSQEVTLNSLFVAVEGVLTDGHQYISAAIKKGALAIVCQNLPDDIIGGVTYVVVTNSAEALGIIASNFYQNPSQKLQLVGITGTNGKTTVATLLYQLFTDLGFKTGLISTVENKICNQVIPSTHTTPNPIALNQLLFNMVTEGCQYCFIEVSSHAVVQQRIAGLTFAGGVFTNITHDHLDFHKTFDNYIKAKKGFFDGLNKSAFALTNIDDKNGNVMLQNTQAIKKTYALKTLANFKGKIIENQFSGLHLDVNGSEVYFKMVGSFNAYNLLAVYGTAILLLQDSLTVLTILSKLSGAEGRFDYILSPNNIIGIVDYAHTPDAVQNVLSTINDLANGNQRIITIIGCGGDRDKSKRPIMAKTACDWSHKVIFTADNPRTEDAQKIIDDMMVGVLPNNLKKVMCITNRLEAIKTACHLAQPGDIILLAGKGHEKYQDINGTKNHFDDKETLTQQFNLLA